MSKLVLQLLISDQNGKIYRNTGIRLFDLKSYRAAISAAQAKSFGLISKGKFVVQLPRPIYDGFGVPNSYHLDWLWGKSNGSGIVPLFLKFGERNNSILTGPLVQPRKNGPYYGVNEDISRLFNETH